MPTWGAPRGDRQRRGLPHVDGELRVTRMEFRHFTGPLKGRELVGQTGECYSVDNYHLRNGARAAIGEEG
jgi:hypothetical protein